MNELQKLRDKVCKLEAAYDKEEQVRILQEIGAELINEYVIEVGNMVIEPLLVEAYYYHKDKFPDNSVHAGKESNAPTYKLARQRQKNHFGELYVHYGTKDGIDVVLSTNDEYDLSFLIKNALVDNKMVTQCKISEMLCEKCDKCNDCQKGAQCKYYGKVILKSAKPKNFEIVFVKRRGLTNDYANEILAALPINKIRDYPFTAGQSVTEIVRCYIEEQLRTEGYNEDQLKQLAKGIIAWKKLKG